MSSLEVDITTYSDADFSMTQTEPFANGLASVSSNPLHMQVRSAADDPTVWIQLTSAAGQITVGGGGSSVTVLIPQTMLQNLPAGTYVYSVIMSSNNGANRSEVWRGVQTHNVGPTKWTAGTP